MANNKCTKNRSKYSFKGGKTKCDKTYDGINQRKCL